MKKLISIKTAYFYSMLLFFLFLFFHIFITIGIQFYNFNLTNYLWGGQLNSKTELIQFEMISILIHFLCIIILYLRFNKFSRYKDILNIFIWTLFILFVLNTIGNLFAKSLLEKIIFTPITIALSLFMFRIGIEKEI